MKKYPLLAGLLLTALVLSRPASLRAQPADLAAAKAAVTAARAKAKKNLAAIGKLTSANAAKLSILLPYAAEYEPDLADLSIEALGKAAADKRDYWEDVVVKTLQAERERYWNDPAAQGSDKESMKKRSENVKAVIALDKYFVPARLLADDAAIDKKLIKDWPAVNRETDADIIKRKTSLFNTVSKPKK